MQAALCRLRLSHKRWRQHDEECWELVVSCLLSTHRQHCPRRYTDQLALNVASRVQARLDAQLGSKGNPRATLEAGITVLHAAIEATFCCRP